MRKILTGLTMTGLIALTLAAATAPALAQDDDQHAIRVHKIQKMVDCDDDADCKEGQHVFISSDGNVELRSGDDQMLWTSDDGSVKVLGGAHRMLWTGEDGNELAFFGGIHSGSFLGVQLTELTDQLRVHFGVPEGQGVMVSSVVDDSPAFRAGLRAGDVITGVDGDLIQASGNLRKTIAALDADTTVNLEVWRDGQVQTFAATVVGRPEPKRREIKVLMDCDGDDCENEWVGDHDTFAFRGAHALALGGLDCEDCKIEVTCNDGACSCTVDGEDRECSELGGFHSLRHERQ